MSRDIPEDEVRRRRLATLLDGHNGITDDRTNGHTPPVRRRGLPGLRDRVNRVCAVAVDVLGVDGAGVTVMGGAEAGQDGHRDQLGATGALSARLEDLQLTAGEGPCLDAYREGMPVLVADLAVESGRWLGFGSEAIAAGAAAVFSLPLQVGAIRLGTFDLHRRTAGALSREQFADALAMASLATEALLELAEQPDTPRADDADDSDDSDDSDDPAAETLAGWLPDVHAEVHAASGMVSAQAGIDVRSALLRIRAHAFASGEPIHEVARRVLRRDLSFATPDDGGFDDGPTTPHKEGES